MKKVDIERERKAKESKLESVENIVQFPFRRSNPSQKPMFLIIPNIIIEKEMKKLHSEMQ